MITDNNETSDQVIGGMIFGLVRKIKSKGNLVFVDVHGKESGLKYGMLIIQPGKTAEALKKVFVDKYADTISQIHVCKIQCSLSNKEVPNIVMTSFRNMSNYYLEYNNEKIDDSFKLSALKNVDDVTIGHLQLSL